MGPYRLISDGSELPVFAFAPKPEVKNYTVFDVSDRLRERGWLVPAYTFPENRQDLSVLRVVVRAGMHMEMADELLDALADKTRRLESLSAPLPEGVASTTRRSRTRAPAAPHSTSASDLPAASSCLSVDASMTRSRSRMRAPIASSSRVPTTA